MTCATSSTRSLRARLLESEAYVAALETAVDAAWESHDPAAEELDAQLACARERFAEVEAELIEYESSDELEEPDYHEGVSVEEQLVEAYGHFLRCERRGPYGGQRAAVLANMRSTIEALAKHPITVSDDEILAAARDIYEATLARRMRLRARLRR